MRAGAAFKAYLASPSDCGLAITVNSGRQAGVDWGTEVQPQPAQAGFNFPEKDPYAAQFENIVPKSPEEFLSKRRDFMTGAPIGNANIESQSEPPPIDIMWKRDKNDGLVPKKGTSPVMQAQEKQTPNKKPAIKKPIAKKKPTAKKTTPKG